MAAGKSFLQATRLEGPIVFEKSLEVIISFDDFHYFANRWIDLFTVFCIYVGKGPRYLKCERNTSEVYSARRSRFCF